MLKKLLNPKLIIPTLLSAGLLTFLLNFADSSKVAGAMLVDIPKAVVPVVLLTLLYMVVKGLEWWINLTRLDIKVRWQDLVIPFVGGEIGNNLPLGVYMENFLLKGTLGAGIWRSSAATTWMLIMEVVICLLALLAVDVPGWPWLRLVIIVVLLGMLFFGLVVFRARFVQKWLSAWNPRQKWLRAGKEGVIQFLDSGRQLFTLTTFLYGLPMTALYLGAYAATIYVIGKGLIHNFGWQPALASYAFSVLAVLLLSFLPNLGSVETTGTAVLLAFGINQNLGAGIFLIMRVLTTGTITLICLLVLLFFYRQVGQMLNRLGSRC